MRSRVHERRLRSLCLSCAFFCAAPLTAQVVINEAFETGVPAGLNLIGTSQLLDDGCGNSVLSLTQGADEQAGHAWFENQFDLTARRVEIDFDVLIGRSTSPTPADGVSVLFQFDGDMNATGGGGGGLGVANFRQMNSPYVSVGFDIWDNGGADPETPCDDGRYGGPGHCGIEVNQNNADPGTFGSQATGPSPDFIASADVYGTPAAPGSCDPADFIHVTIIFDNRLMLVKMSGGLGTDGLPFGEETVISYATATLPPRLSNIGFGASTGGANAHQWVDNVVVREAASKVRFVAEAALSSAGINSGGPAVDATAEIGASFRADGVFGSEVSRAGDIDEGLTITTSRFGRVALGYDFAGANPRPIDVTQIPSAAAQTAKLFANDAWSAKAVHYRAEVVPGRYDVSLYWAENFGPAINGAGQGTKLYDVSVNGTKVLCNWSAASAAGSPTGSGDPSVPCNAALDTAIRRTFSVSVPDGGGGFGTLDVVIDDLGGGIPPENAALNAISIHRTGAPDGGAVTGTIECLIPSPTPPPPGVFISDDFEAVPENQCPPAMSCNSSGGYVPQVVGGRLRLTDDTVFNTGTTAVFLDTVDVASHGLKAEFDVYMGNADAAPAADGGSFFVMEGNNTSIAGPGGGGIGIPGGAYGFAVEFDSWQGPETNEPSGFNNAAVAFVHVGINNLSAESTITNVQYNPDFVPAVNGGTGWLGFFDPAGVHVEIEYNAGHVKVIASGFDESLAAFGPAVVAEAEITPLRGTEAIVGFTGGTGGATQDLEFDDVEISAAPGATPTDDPLIAALNQARARWTTLGELYINAGGTTLLCDADQFPAPIATGDAGPGEKVVWVGDSLGRGAPSFTGEFFAVTPLLNSDGTTASLQVAGTDMGFWDARGTSPGLNDNDAIFHTERWAAMQYDIPVANGNYDVTLYFANSFSGTAGTARRVFHVDIEGDRKDGFDHCESSGKPVIGAPLQNPFFGFDTLFDPVDEAEALYSSAPCDFASCAQNGVVTPTDPDADRILAGEECGNAAASALRYIATVSDGNLTIALTPPDLSLGEPASPDGNPKVSGIVVKRQGVVGALFRRGDSDGDGGLNITDGVHVLNWLFTGGTEPPCHDASDANDSGDLNITDGVHILNYLFTGGPAPPAPGPDVCGPDPTDDELPACVYENC